MRILLAALFALLLAPAAFAQKSDGKPDAPDASSASPFVGTWEYVVRPDDPVAGGTFTLTVDADGAYEGTFQTDGTRKLIDIVAEGDRLAFAFDQPGMGRIEIEGTVTDGAFAGTAHPEGQEALPMTATLHSDTATE